ncbi:Laccase domain protein YfiH [Andreprevotia sp. IGB-42]|uniref:peptidoglycan editing factor PgeF n=1 Tax=Andreprevotia sp. IGB-42 TaxID=2497473 RepID=UPI00135CB6CA|nr:peptidoglycan editing factor PgeF [Andreprevotia sp. IGB-42]KAF0813063.1 Laccase domain protein YfiH [Andreprevotia sp. IGB-42]
MSANEPWPVDHTGTDWIIPDWPAPAQVRALVTTRNGGVSSAPYASLNLGDHVGDDIAAVTANRALVGRHLPAAPLWLTQVHGTTVADTASAAQGSEADASISRGNIASAIMTADCLPVLFCDRAGTVVAAAHAGWRGLCDGVLEATITAMGIPGTDLLAWLGPAIGPARFEVGEEVRAAFVAHDAAAASAFTPGAQAGKWLADMYLLARQRLASQGLTAVYGGDFCTVTDSARFFSYRRDRITGRMASLVWLQD